MAARRAHLYELDGTDSVQMIMASPVDPENGTGLAFYTDAPWATQEGSSEEETVGKVVLTRARHMGGQQEGAS